MNTSANRHPMSPAMKMAELLDTDFSLLGVATRLGLHFGFGEATVAEVCQKAGIDPETFLLICRVYAFDGYRPTQEALSAANLKDILQYLHQSHAYYTEVVVPEMAAALECLIGPCEEKQQRIIRKFFADYKEELSKHFAYEEGQVFPYVEAVLNKQNSAPFTIGEYEENHSNVEEKLEDLKNLVMKYIPAPCNQQEAYKVLFDIYALEYDLGKHTFIEDDILVPMVGRMENHE